MSHAARHPWSVLAVLALAAACSDLPAGVLYRCEPDGSCAPAGAVCWDDGYCHPASEQHPADAGLDAGAPAASVDAGQADAGEADAGEPDGGADAGPSDAGACVPESCPVSVECGYFDSGCGVVECPWLCTPGQECGVQTANVCGLPKLCTADGWCWENPLPLGATLRGGFSLDARHTWFVGDRGTVLFWNGEHSSLVAVPAAPLADFSAVSGTSSDDLVVVGPGPTLLHYDGAAWELEGALGGYTGPVFSVQALGNGVAVAGGAGVILRRSPAQPAATRWSADSIQAGVGEDVRAIVLPSPAGPVAATFAGTVLVPLSPTSTTWRQLVKLDVQVEALWGDATSLFAAGRQVGGVEGALARRDADGGWTQYLDAGLPELRAVGGFGSADVVLAGTTQLWHFQGEDDAGRPLASPVPSLGRDRFLSVAVSQAAPPLAMLGGELGQLAQWSDAGVRAFGSGSLREVNALCGPAAGVVYGASVNDGTATDYRVRSLQRRLSSAGVEWVATDVSAPLLGNTELTSCFAQGSRAWLTGNGGKFLARNAATGAFEPADFGPNHAGAHFQGWGLPAGPTFFPSDALAIDFTRDAGLDDTAFTRVALGGAPNDVRALWGVAGTTAGADVFAVGRAGALWSCNGTCPDPIKWSRQAAPSLDSMTALHGERLADGGVLFVAVGDGGVVWRRTGTGNFAKVPTPAGQSFGGVSFSGVWVNRRSGEAWVVGNDAVSPGARGGWVLHGNTTAAYTRENLPLAGINTVWGWADDAGTSVWVGGAGGAILRQGPP